MYVQYGCGFCAPESWVNFDASPTLRFERVPVIGRLYTRNSRRFPPAVRYGDIVRGLPIPLGGCDGIYASHVLEHLALSDCSRALTNTRSYLKSGGIFRLVVPDLAQIAGRYVQSRDGHAFMRESGLGRQSRSWTSEVFGNSAHLWLWDEYSMGDALRKAGFTSIRRAAFNDSSDVRFCEVEQLERFEGCLAMECRAG
jgi:hypothetical protein